MMKKLISILLSIFLCLQTQGVTEKLNRGLVAVKTSVGVFLSWRLLDTDSDNTGFYLYRDGTKVQAAPYTTTTNCLDRNGVLTSEYTLETLKNGEVTETFGPVKVWAQPYLTLSLDRPSAGTTPPYTVSNNKVTESYPNGQDYTYTPNDCSVGDVDGDGEYEIIVKWNPSNSRDNSLRGFTGNVYLDCYKLNGTKLWRIDLGRNIRAGAHYTQFMVYDLDGDGKAEVACKTAPGTLDGTGTAVLLGNDTFDADYRTEEGLIMSGSEYLTVFKGETGAALHTIAYNPLRTISSKWGDTYGNRSERYLACIAYLDGVRPSLVMCRGYYTLSYLWAVDFNGTQLTSRWLHASTSAGSGAYGEGAHGISVADVDGDGCDEIIYGACTINNDGKLLYRTGWGHGDALHVSDLDPDLPGLEIFMPHESKSSPYGYEMHAAASGKLLWGVYTGTDVGRGVAADIDGNSRGFECWAVDKTFDCKGNVLAGNKPAVNFRIYWDGDLYDELLDGNSITKWNGTGATLKGSSCNSTKKTPNLSADLFGDWREEVILHDASTGDKLYIHTTTTLSNYRMPTLMHDHVYRMGIAWQNVAYNQPPHLGYYLPDAFTATLQRIESSGPDLQTIELGDSIQSIVYHFAKATSAYCTGISTYGLTCTIDTDAQTATISGTPTKTGIVNYTLRTQGTNLNVSVTGKIYVNEPSGIQPLPDAQTEPVWYDLQGRRIQTPTQGIYLLDGKKIYLKK